MGTFVANKVIKLMIKKGIHIEGSKALILGITFKENCPDVRNSQVIDIYNELRQFGLIVDVFDPVADKKEVKNQYGVELINNLNPQKENLYYDAVVLAVPHSEFLTTDLYAVTAEKHVIFDTKAVLKRELVDGRL